MHGNRHIAFSVMVNMAYTGTYTIALVPHTPVGTVMLVSDYLLVMNNYVYSHVVFIHRIVYGSYLFLNT